MENNKIHMMLKASKIDSNSLITLIEKFQPLLRKYASYLKYEDAYDDLLIDFIEFTKKFKADSIINKDDYTLISYIRKTIHNSYLKKSKINAHYKKMHQLFNELSEEQELLLECITDEFDLNSEIEDDFFQEYLTEFEFSILKLIFYHDYKVQEISKLKNISRQAVNQTKIRAIHKLKNIINL